MRFTTKEVGSLTDYNKTSVLVETMDNITGEIWLSLGVAIVKGGDRFDENIGHRIAFDKAYKANLLKIEKEFNRAVKWHNDRANDYLKDLAIIENSMLKVEKDLDLYTTDKVAENNLKSIDLEF